GPVIRRGVVAVEDDLQATDAGTLDNTIHERQSLESFQIGVQLVVDPLWLARRVKELITVGQANGVEPILLDLIEHILPVAYLQTMRGKSTGFKAKPVDTRQLHLASRCIHQLAVKGMQEATRGPVLT